MDIEDDMRKLILFIFLLPSVEFIAALFTTS